MKIVQINSYNFGSTGNIMLGVAQLTKQCNNECIICVPMQRTNCTKEVDGQLFIGNRILRNIGLRCSKITGYEGCFSYLSTKQFLKKIDEYEPDVIQLHNLHNSYINLALLFGYIKRKNIKVVWTLHDCWAFTGQCPYFTMVKCGKWKTGCHDCPQYRQYPESYVDRTKTMWKLKKKWFTGIQNMTIVTPSHWLAALVKESYLKEYPVKVIHNGIDLDVFQPIPGDFKQRYHCEQKYVVLGVAFGWGKRKGLDVFIELAKRLEAEKYQIVLVGTDEKTDKSLPDNIISIHCTQNQKELAEIYTAADVFANPTREEVLGLVNIEALACGTPVITFNTGGSPECIDETCGIVVECDDVDALESGIINICETKLFSKEVCLKRAKGFDKNQKFKEYVELYESKTN